MIKMIKSYNAYTSKIIVFLAYVLFPVVMISLFSVLTLFIKTTDSKELNVLITVLTAIVMAYQIVVISLSDRFSIGTILVNNLQANEMVKTSPKGEKTILNVVTWDIFVKFFSTVAVFLGIFIARFYFRQGKVSELAGIMIICVFSTHFICSLVCWICRKIENNTIAVIIQSIGTLQIMPFIVISVLPVKAIPVWISGPVAAVYLIGDVIVNIVGILILKGFIQKSWYKDVKSKGQ
ncbi:MAG: hypothetical protein J6P37_04805 [Lachnospiraceae bacterium]|nr:hypothetical protein [Lachnospiraceae bacterium]